MELFSLAILGLLIVISPGADFVLVFKNSVSQGRTTGLLTALGISFGISLHITYSILGISHFIARHEFLLSTVKYAGALYLIYLGISGFFNAQLKLAPAVAQKPPQSMIKSVLQGFLCNALNPKTMLFFLSIFSQLISSSSTNHPYVFVYGIYLALLHGLWFSLVACLVTSAHLTHILQRFSTRINQACGVGLIALGTLLGLNT
ncbi:LysE family translocator [Vibrio sp. PP-XX7]